MIKHLLMYIRQRLGDRSKACKPTGLGQSLAPATSARLRPLYDWTSAEEAIWDSDVCQLCVHPPEIILSCEAHPSPPAAKGCDPFHEGSLKGGLE